MFPDSMEQRQVAPRYLVQILDPQKLYLIIIVVLKYIMLVNLEVICYTAVYNEYLIIKI